MTPSAHVLEAHGVASDRGGSRVLSNVDLCLSRGDSVALQGASGSGKSTLLGVLGGLIRPIAGEVELLGRPFGSLPDRVRSRLRLNAFGLVFQADEFLPELTIGENVSLPLRLLGSADSDALAKSTTRLLSRLDIGDLEHRFPAQVSGGQLQRAAIARALIHSPAIVLADEPTGSLDRQTATEAMTLLLHSAAAIDAAVVVVTHSEKVASACGRRVVLENGELAEASHAAESVV